MIHSAGFFVWIFNPLKKKEGASRGAVRLSGLGFYI
jgi:hypothetical protein